MRFNLIDEPWIPIAGAGLVSLAQVFDDKSLTALGGNPIQKIALTKLLLAICQAAWTPEDDGEWKNVGAEGMAEKARAYLAAHRDCFWLYGEKPFLQMPELKELLKDRESKPIGYGFYPDIMADNNTILTDEQRPMLLTNAEKAVFIVTLMNFAFGGKRVEKDMASLAGTQIGIRYSAGYGPSLGNFVGYLHSFVQGCSLIDTLYLNVFTNEIINENDIWQDKTLIPPWEEMPKNEDDAISKRISSSYMGCLVGMSRFVLLDKDGIYYTDGIKYPSHKDGWREPTMAVNGNGQVLWIDTHKKPWRETTALLAFLNEDKKDYFCHQLAMGLERVQSKKICIGIWAGGLRVSVSSGDQSVKKDDDFVESVVVFDSSFLSKTAYMNLKNAMENMEKLQDSLKKSMKKYFAELTDPQKKTIAKNYEKRIEHASETFWQLCEREFSDLLTACEDASGKENEKLKPEFAKIVKDVYEKFCPQESARQLSAWAEHYPYLGGNYGKTKNET